MVRRPPWILPVIVGCQFAGSSIWFSGNAILGELTAMWAKSAPMAGWVTGAVQLGFITGTLVFALLAVADRFSPRRLFLLCTAAGGIANLMPLVLGTTVIKLLAVRFACGFFIAGIYPVGMKIAAGWYSRRLGNTLGYLIGALVIGTAFPHLLKGTPADMPWQVVLMLSSAICLAGGALMFVLVPDGPHLVKGGPFNPLAVAALFTHRPLRKAALGYFGHMWELYSLWAFLPLFLSAYAAATSGLHLNIPLWSFLIIGMGSIGCVGGGMVSCRVGSGVVARSQLAVSGVCCLCSPLLFRLPPGVFLATLLVWGATVAGDSPQFSTIVARSAPRERMGSALTLVNCIGFLITVLSLALLQWLSQRVPPQYLLLVLAPGPALGLIGMRRLDQGDQDGRVAGKII